MASVVADVATTTTDNGTAFTAATAADNDVGTVTTNYTSFLSAYDTLAAAIVAISGDTYSATTHQFTTGGSTGLTSAQLHTTMTSLNSAITTFLAAGTAFISFLYEYDALAAVIVAISGDTYSSTTHQFTEGGSTALTSTQVHTAMTSLNAAITAFLAAQTFFTTLKTATALVKTDITTVVNDLTTTTTDAATAKAATAAALTATNALSTSAIAADLTASQAIITNANIFIQADDSVVTNVAALNGGLVACLTFVRDTGILPT
jgi:hypothetical protein